MTYADQQRLESIRGALVDRRLRVVASEIDMTYAALSRIMRGGQPSRNTMSKIETYLERTSYQKNEADSRD